MRENTYPHQHDHSGEFLCTSLRNEIQGIYGRQAAGHVIKIEYYGEIEKGFSSAVVKQVIASDIGLLSKVSLYLSLKAQSVKTQSRHFVK